MALRRYHGLSTNLRALQIRKLKDVKGRIIIVGDVHGCVNELNALVEKCKYSREAGDVLIMVGDYVNKGYDSVSVVKRCVELGAYGVLGNHDFTLLHVADAIDAGLCQEQVQQQLTGTAAKKDAVIELACNMPHECMAYLRQLPHIIRIPQHNVIVLHAGIDVSVPLEQQDVFDVMHIRTISEGRDGIKRGSYGGKGQLWAELYEGPEQIVFGHDARTGFREYKHALALDSGCVYGNALTAVVYDSATPMRGTIVQVPSQYNVKASEVAATPGTVSTVGFSASPAVGSAAAAAGNISPGDSPAPLIMNTHAVQREISKGFTTNAASTPLALAGPSSHVYPTPPSFSASARAVKMGGAVDDGAAVLAVMISTVKAFITAGLVDSLALLSKIPSYAARWEEVLGAESSELGRSDWEGVIEQLFLALSDMANGVLAGSASSTPSSFAPGASSSSTIGSEEDRLVSYLNLITDILDARGPEAAENVAAMAHAACDGVKKKYPSHARLIKQVKLALP